MYLLHAKIQVRMIVRSNRTEDAYGILDFPHRTSVLNE